jgi:hypothetical protein
MDYARSPELREERHGAFDAREIGLDLDAVLSATVEDRRGRHGLSALCSVALVRPDQMDAIEDWLGRQAVVELTADGRAETPRWVTWMGIAFVARED